MNTDKTLHAPFSQDVEKKVYKKQILFYGLIIGILTCLYLGSYIFQSQILHQQETHSTIINHSGRQRMFSQNIVARVLEYKVDLETETTDTENLTLLKEALAKFVSYHSRFMLDPSDSDILADLNNDKTSKIYQERGGDVLLFTEKTKQFLELTEQKKMHHKLLTEYVTTIAHLGLGPVLSAMDSLTFERAEQSKFLLEKIERSQMIIFVMFLAIMILVVLFVFTSEIRRQKSALTQLQHFYEKEKELHAFSALGEVSAKIAHEINSPLSALFGRVEILLNNKNNSFDEKTMKIFTSMNESLVRIANIIRLTKIIYRKGDIDLLSVFDLKKVVIDVVESTQFLKGVGKIKFNCNLEEGHFVKAAEHQIFQVINNVVGNSIDATLNQKERVINIDLFAINKTICLRISDNGPGVAVGIENEIFKKLFTTKVTGTGIGLYESKEIIESYGGSMGLATEISRSCFEIKMPSW